MNDNGTLDVTSDESRLQSLNVNTIGSQLMRPRHCHIFVLPDQLSEGTSRSSTPEQTAQMHTSMPEELPERQQ